jgi:dTMP kinase
MLIAIEGGDAAGKATQTQLLCAELAKRGPVSSISFPQYQRPAGQAIKDLLTGRIVVTAQDDALNAQALLLQSLFVADRYERLPELRAARNSPTNHVVLDRYIPSGLVYGQTDNLELSYLLAIHQGLPPADLWIFLDVDPGLVSDRRPVPRDRYERDVSLAPKVRKLYKALFKQQPLPGKWIVVDGDRSIEEVHDDVYKHAASVISEARTWVPIDAAHQALTDHAKRQSTKNKEAGSQAWARREPILADYVVSHASDSDTLSKRGMVLQSHHRNEIAQLAAKIADLSAELRDTRFERDRAVFSYQATYDLAVKIAREYADPERIDDKIEQALETLKPDSERSVP